MFSNSGKAAAHCGTSLRFGGERGLDQLFLTLEIFQSHPTSDLIDSAEPTGASGRPGAKGM